MTKQILKNRLVQIPSVSLLRIVLVLRINPFDPRNRKKKHFTDAFMLFVNSPNDRRFLYRSLALTPGVNKLTASNESSHQQMDVKSIIYSQRKLNTAVVSKYLHPEIYNNEQKKN